MLLYKKSATVLFAVFNHGARQTAGETLTLCFHGEKYDTRKNVRPGNGP
jgi:hypothetical protein